MKRLFFILVVVDVLLTTVGFFAGRFGEYDRGYKAAIYTYADQTRCITGVLVVPTELGFLTVGDQQICGIGLWLSPINGPATTTPDFKRFY